MNNKEIEQKRAKEMLDIALEFGKLKDFLCGSALYRLETQDSMGNKINNYHLVMQSIYDKYNEDKSSGIDKRTFEAIIDFLKTEKYEPLLLNIINDIEYQMLAEKQGVAPFKLDCIEMLKELKNNIERNKERFKDARFDTWKKLEDHDQIINQNYGHRIL